MYQTFESNGSPINSDLTLKAPVTRLKDCPIRTGTGGLLWAQAGFTYGLTTGATQYIVATFNVDQTVDVEEAIDIYAVGFHNIAISNPNQDMGYNLQACVARHGNNGNSAALVNLTSQVVTLGAAPLRVIQRFMIGTIPASTLEQDDHVQIRFDRISTGDEITNTFYFMGIQAEYILKGI